MGEMLTYLEGRSMQYWWVEDNKIQYADENYAREIMQLFSIGLYKLNNDGTRQVDESGNFIRAYTNDHIMEYSRIYTGFRKRPIRGNIETRAIKGSLDNRIDPMKKHIEFADHLPKVCSSGLFSVFLLSAFRRLILIPSGLLVAWLGEPIHR